MNKLVVLTNSEWRKSIAITRLLGRKNYKVILCRRNILEMACWSKYCYKSHKVSNKNFVNDLINIGKKYFLEFQVKPILIFCEDLELNLVLKNKSRIKKYFSFLLPDNRNLICGLDKLNLYKNLVKNKNLKKFLPETISLEKVFSKNINPQDLLKKDKKLVLKPKSGSGSLGIKYLNKSNINDLLTGIKMPEKFIIQEYINSESISFCVTLFMDKFKIPSSFLIHRRIYQYPITGGPSTQRETTYNFDLIRNSVEILKFLNWKGIAMVEWKYCINSKKYYLIEINPRPGGSICLDEKASSEIILNYCKSFLSGEKLINHPISLPYYKLKEKSTWSIPGDCLRYFSTRKNKESFLNFLMAQIHSEEFAFDDIPGFIGIIVSQFLFLFKPSTLKYLRR